MGTRNHNLQESDGSEQILESFRTLQIASALDTSSSDLLNDFFVPILSRAIQYDRGVGYFTSGWLRVASQGMALFAEHGGRARWVTSPILDKHDWLAIQTGDEARANAILKSILDRMVEDLRDALANDTLSGLAWMVADEVITFKLALPRSKLDGGEFHDKFGIFSDLEGNRISFNGSYNDSIQGTRNYESIKIFWSWDPSFAPHVEIDSRRFEKLWTGQDPNVRVFNLPEATRERILKLRSYARPYAVPGAQPLRRIIELGKKFRFLSPSLPDDIELRDYQEEAIRAWLDNGCRGILEMATGTGKTITSLAASVKLFEREGSLALIITVPFQHLVDQWKEEAIRFGYNPVLAYRNKQTWLESLNERILSYNHKDASHLCVIATHATFASDHFYRTIESISGPTLLIADEAHHLGAQRRRSFLPAYVEHRLALSATPIRWFDDKGTEILGEYFGQTVFEFSIADAIGVCLTPYYYYPVLVELTHHELDRYRKLSAKIARIIHARGLDESDEQLTRLLINRADLLNSAENKLGVLSELVDRQANIQYTLFYCAPRQIDKVVRMLGWEKRLEVHRFTAREDNRIRQRLLKDFASGQLAALVAMHCLDEGVDVPSTRTAYILASSSNPRQFIQRRGRILRKAEGKEFAILYDLITVPPPPGAMDNESLNAERSILRRELARFIEFAESAQNSQAAYNVIWDLASSYGILDF